MVLGACEPGPPPAEPIARQYAAAWQKSDYQAMWDLLTDDARAQITPAGFIERLPRIAEEMTLRSLEARPGTATHPPLPNGSPDPRKASVPLDVTFHTQRVGDLTRTTTLNLVMIGEKDKAVWRIAWTPEAIIPHLTTGRLVRMTRLPTSRGRIIARDGTELATFIEAGVVGVVTGQVRSESGLLSSLSTVLAMKPDDIKAKYTQSWVKPDLFVPIKVVPAAQLDAVRARLAVIEGVQVQATRVRSYPTGLASQTLGFLAEASEDDAKARAARGVQAGDLIGKKDTGLEATVNIFQMEKDGITPAQSPYLQRQAARAQSVLEKLNTDKLEIDAAATSDSVIRVACFMGWALFRKRIDFAPYSNLVAFFARAKDIPHFAETAPPA